MPCAALYSCNRLQISQRRDSGFGTLFWLNQPLQLQNADLDLFFWTILKWRFFDKREMLTALKSEREEKIV